MKSENITKLIFAVAAFGGLAFLASTKHAANYLPNMGIAVSYLAVLALMVLAAVDKGAGYRRLS